MGCGEFFAMIEEPKLHERLKGVTVRFVTRYTEDSAESLEMSTPIANAMSTVFQAMACLLVLLEPTPGFLGTSASAVAKIVAYESSNPEDFLSALRLHLADQGIWQSRVDEVLKLGGSALKFGQELKEHVDKMKSISGQDGFSEHFVQAVNVVDTLRNGLRKHAVDELLSLIRETTQKYIDKLCSSPSVSESDGGIIQVLMQAIDKFPQKDMLQLKQKFLKWQQSVQVELLKQEASALGNKILNQAGNDDEEIPLDDLAKLLDKFKAEKELKDDAKQLLQQFVWAIMTKASNLKWLAYQIFSLLDGFGKLAFADPVAESLKLQMQYMQDGLYVLKQMEKFRKLGSDPAGRLKNDVRWGALLTYVKQLEGLRTVRDKASSRVDVLASSAPTEHAKLKELCFSDLDRPFQVPEDMKDAFVFAMKAMQKDAEELIDKMGDSTQNLHLPKSRRKKDLKPDATAETVKMCIASSLDFDVSQLEPTLQALKEASVNAKIAIWKKKVTFLKTVAELEDESKAFFDTCEKVNQSLVSGHIFRSEGILANALMESNKGEAQKLVRVELSYLAGDHWQLGINETHVHAAVLAAAKQLLDKK
ncbi:unnamed protein product [Symbiodinium sp. CCMP2592]|nr:unnamed protein product [Symbiodinium sp. CCMP2592]